MTEDYRDKGWAWVIAAACFWISLTAVGVIPSYGVLYTIVVDSLNVTREVASWPFTVGNSFTGLGTCLSGLLNGYFAIRTQVAIASILCFVGIFFCYFAKSIALLCIFFGVINGLGAGISNGCSLIIICQYFLRYTTVATGLLYAGISMSCFAFPPLMQHLSDIYNLNGCLLIVSGIALNSLLGAMLYRTPPSKVDNENVNIRMKRRSSELPSPSLTTYSEPKQKAFSQHLIEEFKRCVNIFKFPMFHLITACFETFNFCYYAYLLIIVDNAVDVGVDKVQSSFLISMFSVMDLIGRLSIGWIVDFGWIKVRHLFLILYAFLGTLYVSTPFLTNYAALSVSASICGFISGSIMSNWTVSLNDYLGTNLLPPAIAVSALIYTLLSLCLPFLIGCFRVIRGRYDVLFYIFGGLQFVCCSLWLMEPLATKLQCRTLNPDINTTKL